MNTLPLDLYKVMELGLGGDTWQEWVDRYAEKYDAVEIDGFTKAPTSLDYNFHQYITSLGAKALPAYVDPESPGYEKALREVEGITGTIPTMKQFYRLNRVVVRQQLQLLQRVGNAAMTEQMQNAFMSLMDEGTDGLIGSYMNALNHQRMRVVSTGEFTIDATNNPRGLNGITIKFGIPDNHFDTLSSTARWWTKASHTTANEGSASDPIKYIKDRVKAIRRTFHYLGKIRMELSQDLLDDMFTHSKVLKEIGMQLYPAAASEANAIAYANALSDEAKLEALRKACKLDEIVARDSYAYVDKPGTGEDGQPDLVQEVVENFKSTNIAFIPTGNIGTIQGVEPLTLGYEADKVAKFDEGRLVLAQRANPATHSIYIDAEAAQLCVPSVPQFMFISTVTV